MYHIQLAEEEAIYHKMLRTILNKSVIFGLAVYNLLIFRNKGVRLASSIQQEHHA